MLPSAACQKLLWYAVINRWAGLGWLNGQRQKLRNVRRKEGWKERKTPLPSYSFSSVSVSLLLFFLNLSFWLTCSIYFYPQGIFYFKSYKSDWFKNLRDKRRRFWVKKLKTSEHTCTQFRCVDHDSIFLFPLKNIMFALAFWSVASLKKAESP